MPVEDRRSRAGARRSGARDRITITRWSLGLSLTLALTVVTAAFTLVWNQTAVLGETQMQLVASVGGLDARVTGLDQRVTGLESEVRGLRTEMREEIGGLRAEMREEIGGLREEIGELADLIRERAPEEAEGR
ncbi:hypothetical protein [Candidatus Palauibacter sp.]|uniref:hypothetical protein n=1 Tax=Candidatus Palauibacter sp. TaxID=3101350 RepID=UPI003B01A5D1